MPKETPDGSQRKRKKCWKKGQHITLRELKCMCWVQISHIINQYHSQNDSGDLRGVAGGDGELGCLCGKAGTSHLCDGSAHSSGCVVNDSNAMAAF